MIIAINYANKSFAKAQRFSLEKWIDSHRMNVGSMAELKWKRTSIYRFYKKCAQKLVFLTTKKR